MAKKQDILCSPLMAAAPKQPQPLEQPAKNAIGDAIRAHQQHLDVECAAADKLNRHGWACYVQILLRADNPQPNDSRQLRDVMLDCGISADRLLLDLALVGHAQRLQSLHGQREQAHAKSVELTEAHRDLQKRQEVEDRQAFRAAGTAQAFASECGFAAHELDLLRRQRPELFSPDAVPMLLDQTATPTA